MINNQDFDKKKERHLPLFFCERVVRYLTVTSGFLFVCSFVIPNHYVPWLAFYNDYLAALALLSLLIVCVIQVQELRLSILHIFIFILALLPITQWLLGRIHFFGDGLMASLYVFGFGLAVFLGGNLTEKYKKEQILTFFAILTLLVAVLSVFIAMYQWLELKWAGVWIIDAPPGGRPFANLGQPNNLSTLLCMGVASLVYLWEQKRVGSLVAVILAIVIIFGIALARSRTAWIVGAVFLIWWMWKRDSLKLKLGWPPMLGTLCLYLLFLLGLPTISVFLGLPVSADSEGMEVGARGLIWQQLFDAVLRGPLWGYGWNQVSLAQIMVVQDYPDSLYVADSHNLFLDLILWNGPVIGLLLSLLVIYWGIKNAFKSKNLETWYCLSCIGFFAIHSMLELPHSYAHLLLPVGFLIGLVSSGAHLEPKGLNLSKRVLIPMLAVGMVLLVTIFVDYRKIEEDSRLLRFESRRIGSLKAEAKAPDTLLLTQLRDFLALGRTQASQSMSDEDIEWFEKIAHRYPLSSSLFRYTVALALNSRLDEAWLELQRIKNLYGDEKYQEAIENLSLLQAEYPQIKELGILLEEK